MGNRPEERRTVARNRRATHVYEILEELECGVSLVGTEVKSLRAGHASIAEAHARIRGGELWLIGATIPEYAHGNINNHVPTRDRKLLVHRRELTKLYKRVKEKGLTLVPLELYFQGSLVKLSLALGRGKRLHDKRADKAKRDAGRDVERALRRRR
jgi:SsrA-binding protein